jgi:soluble lytic murein transglycosylase-like protein
MRLFVLALAAVAFVLPASAREYSRHHHWRHAAYSHHQFVRADDETWGDRAPGRRFADVAEPRSERAGRFGAGESGHGGLDSMIARHAQAEGVPEALVHRVVIRESRYRPGAVGSGGALGLMQIKYSTARAMGYSGSPRGLLDPETNLTYAVRYLAGAYKVAGGNASRAVANYARGYYGAAKRQGVSPYAMADRSEDWSHSYASAQPVEQVADAGLVLRHYRYTRHRPRRD